MVQPDPPREAKSRQDLRNARRVLLQERECRPRELLSQCHGSIDRTLNKGGA